jgi:hypothetical protein
MIPPDDSAVDEIGDFVRLRLHCLGEIEPINMAPRITQIGLRFTSSGSNSDCPQRKCLIRSAGSPGNGRWASRVIKLGGRVLN